MSSETSPPTVRKPTRLGSTLSTWFRRLTVDGARAVAFWAAIFLPVAYVPAVYGVGVFDGAWSTLALLAAHMVCVVIGHGHNRPDGDQR
ncbi:hypothetical protein J2751_000922 [Halorubrum alkaliphilum]|uniref:Uncharacterized protein n=1 Tax=Halorubrum alkaliphilum TaxID=261290 RepID=A0A8T4GFT9_9EURY|nr:hypothetical protein [Halorubrum alkaliphilum]MBP1921925.1 hypothetical protein [Halorubrum alkaliphilum]